MKQENDLKDTRDWLKSQRQNSWQIETLISSGMLFTLWYLPFYFVEKRTELIFTTGFDTSYEVIIVCLIMASRTLLIGFGVNLFLRVIWLVLLGVHFSFPNGVDHEKLNYSDFFKDKLKQKLTTQQRILKIEQYASLAFSLCLMMVLTAVGTLFLIALLYAAILNWLLPIDWLENPVLGFLLLVIFGAIGFGFFDRVFYQYFKGKKSFQKVYYPISQGLAFLNFSWILRAEWMVLISNIRRWKIHAVTVGYFLIAFFITLLDIDAIDGLSNYFRLDGRDHQTFIYDKVLQQQEYDEHLEEGDLIIFSSIPKEIISGSLLPVFIPYRKEYDETFNKLIARNDVLTSSNQLKSMEEFKENSVKISEMFNSCFLLQIDDKEILNEPIYFRKHPITEQLGFHAKIGIDSLSHGAHVLTTKFRYLVDKSGGEEEVYQSYEIVFWKE